MKKLMTMILVFAMVMLGAFCVSAEEADDATYCFILKTFSNEVFVEMAAGAEDRAEELGIKLDTFAANGEDDMEGQLTLLENAIQQGYDAIAFVPISQDNLLTGLVEAYEKGIYVVGAGDLINVESLKVLGGTIADFTAMDNVLSGSMPAQYVSDQLGGEGKVAIIEGATGTSSWVDKYDGFNQVFDNCDIEIVDSQSASWDRTEAYNIATNQITKFGEELKAIVCMNDTMALGAQEAVNNSGLDILVTGADGTEETLASIAKGEIDATITWDPREVGAKAVDLMYEGITSGKKMDLEADINFDYTDPILVTKDNVEEYMEE